MRCRRARSLLPLLLDGKISLPDYQVLSTHLSQCAQCARLKKEHEVPLPPIPALPARVRARFVQDLDHALETRISELAMRQHHRPPSRIPMWRQLASTSIPGAFLWLSGVVIGASATWILFGAPPITPRLNALINDPGQLQATTDLQAQARDEASVATYAKGSTCFYRGDTLRLGFRSPRSPEPFFLRNPPHQPLQTFPTYAYLELPSQPVVTSTQ